MLRRLIISSLALAAVFALTITGSVAQDSVQLGPITQAVMDRGELICGVHTGLPGFGFVNDAGEWEGFDVDFCRAVAAAMLGDATAVSFRPLSADERQAAIQSGEIDMMSRNTTWTLNRDAVWGATFAPTTFYDGQGFAVNADSGITDLEGLDGTTICVQTGTTTELNLADVMNANGLAYEPLVFDESDATWNSFVEGRCDAFTTDMSGILALVGPSPDPGAYSVLPFVISKEPLGPLSPQSDPQFADIIRWTIFGTIQAEEFGITSENVDDFLTDERPEIQRFLGQGDNAIGTLYGIPNDFMVAVIRQVGNYGEIFDRNLGPDTVFGLERGVNALWTNGGLMYSPPFR
jgi:general L-amino acid transport system substrate-binding protein